MSFVFLLLGHLLGDFTFQTNIIAGNKVKYWKWNLLHAAIVTACMLPFAFLFGLKVVAAVFLNGAAHYFVDHFKARLPVRSPIQELIYFICDQGIHIYLIYIISGLSTETVPGILHIETKFLKLLVALIAIMSFGGVLNQYILRVIFSIRTDKFFLEKEKVIGSVTRVLIFLVLYLSIEFSIIWFLAILILVSLKVSYYYRFWNRWLKVKYFYTRFIIDMITPAIGYYFFIIAKFG